MELKWICISTVFHSTWSRAVYIPYEKFWNTHQFLLFSMILRNSNINLPLSLDPILIDANLPAFDNNLMNTFYLHVSLFITIDAKHFMVWHTPDTPILVIKQIQRKRCFDCTPVAEFNVSMPPEHVPIEL